MSIRPGWFFHESENTKVKTPKKLLDIYYNSVGKNCVLLLNIPPDKEGLLNDSDVSALKNWKKLRDETFKTNLLKGARAECDNGINLQLALDDQYDTYFTTKDHDTTATITMELKKAETFDVLLLQENITVGQRVEKFVFEYWDGGTWKKATEGTTIGYKRLLRFPAVTAAKVRLKIESSRLNPTLSTIALYKQP